MQTKQRKFYQQPLVWAGCVTAGIVLVLVILLLANRAEPSPAAETTQPTQQTEQTGAPLLPENPYGPQDFAFEGNYLTCTAGKSVPGIDVSEWQEPIDWQLVKASGVEFVMIRVGWRGSELGLLSADTCAQSHYAGAKAAGLKVGGYFFSQAVSVEEALEEAAFALQQMASWELDMPMVFDWEYIDGQSRTANVSAETLTDAAKAFCGEIAQAGYRPMVYFNEHLVNDFLYLEELTDYGFWRAQYREGLQYPYRVDLWQYSSTGTVPGIAGNVDLNLYFTYD